MSVTINGTLFISLSKTSKKVKVSLLHARKAHREWVVNVMPLPLYPGIKTHFPIYRRNGGP